MCGIAGIVSMNGSPVREDFVRSMIRVLAHRGPDDEGIFCSGGVGLGHKRLSIFDLSAAGHQPMTSHDGRYVISHNGEVYNWPEIRKQLLFSDWRSKTDTETILQAYIERGPDCLERFNGMFAFAIWDTEERILFLARDRVGIKPLLYGEHDGRFYFASEAKALFAAGFPKQVGEKAIYDYLRWGAIDHGRDTFFKGISCFPQGHWMRISARRGTEIRNYWDITEIVLQSPTVNKDDATERYGELLRESIALRARSDVSIGAFLSGGVDSSIVVSQLTKARSSNISAFTYDFDTGNAGESVYASEVADSLGIKLHHATLGHADVPAYFDKILHHQESPVSSMRVLAVHKLYELCRAKGQTVILEGHGGDQIGAGFEYYWMAAVMDAEREKGPEEARRLTTAFLDQYGIPSDQRKEREKHARMAIKEQGTATQDGRTFVRPDLLGADFSSRHAARPLPLTKPFESYLLNAQYNDFRGGNLQRVLRYTDRASMAVGCEARVPVLDHNIVELSFCSAPDARVNGTRQRHFMREAAKGLLPESQLTRPKRSIVDPQRMWLKNELRPWVRDVLHSEAFAELDFFDTKGVRKEYDDYCSLDGMPPTGFHVFQYVNIALWHDQVIKGDLLTRTVH